MDFHDAKLLIFDLDYTLIDSSDGIVWCFNEARTRAGEPVIAADKLKARIGLPIEEGFRVFGSKDPEAMRELFRKLAREGAMAERSFLLPGVAETLPALKQKGYGLAVASTKSRPEIVAILKHLGVAGYFDEFAGSDEVKDPKPAPASLLLVMERLKAGPETTVYVGDHVVDVRAARAAGVRVIAVRGGPCSPEEVDREKPDAFVSSIRGILDLL
ncbi:MAG TPA: HAD-IA family hydrolase [bacterium]|nr:HAD-IA family hydrolase [bacterium]